MQIEIATIMSVLWGLITVIASGFIYLFWQRILKLETVVDSLQKEMAGMRLNYLDRFDDLKETIKEFELKVVEKIAKLETVITEHTKNIQHEPLKEHK